jgi:hypothetical protein
VPNRAFGGGVRRKVMLSYFLYVVSLVNSVNSVNSVSSANSGFVNRTAKTELMEGDTATGGLVVKMGPVMNVHVTVEDVKVISGGPAVASLPAIAKKGSLFGFSQNRVYAIRYGN